MSKRKKPLHRVAGELRKVNRPPEGQPWVFHTRELLSSPAWRALSLNDHMLIEFLELEHMAHGGAENGYLIATYGQLETWGIPRRSIVRSIHRVEQLGLIAVEHGGYRGYAKTNPTKFRLTYYAEKQVNEWGVIYYGTPTNEWKLITKEQAKALTSPEALTKTYQYQRKRKPALRAVETA